MLVARQRAWVDAHGGGVVEGRDIGTVVFPDAPVKVFLTASRRRAGQASSARRARGGASRTRSTRCATTSHAVTALDSSRGRSSPLAAADDALVHRHDRTVASTKSSPRSWPASEHGGGALVTFYRFARAIVLLGVCQVLFRGTGRRAVSTCRSRGAYIVAPDPPIDPRHPVRGVRHEPTDPVHGEAELFTHRRSGAWLFTALGGDPGRPWHAGPRPRSGACRPRSRRASRSAIFPEGTRRAGPERRHALRRRRPTSRSSSGCRSSRSGSAAARRSSRAAGCCRACTRSGGRRASRSSATTVDGHRGRGRRWPRSPRSCG